MTNCATCSKVNSWTAISATQFKLSMASLTQRFFFLDARKTLGARDFGEVPFSQDEDQKLAVRPSPMVTLVAALNNSLSVSSFGVSNPTHGFSGAVHSSQSHRNRKARANFSRSRMPKPPIFFGRHTLAQLTLHFPPETVSLAAKSIARRSLSKAFKVQLPKFSVEDENKQEEEKEEQRTGNRAFCYATLNLQSNMIHSQFLKNLNFDY